MNQHLQQVVSFIQQNDSLTVDEKNALLKSLKDANKELEITVFKLDRTEKVKKTTAILLEETIEELEQKRKAVEAQNKELEIEAILEKVRSRSLAMHTSDELKDVVKLVFKNLEELKFAIDGAAFIATQTGDSKNINIWIGDNHAEYPTCFKTPFSDVPEITDLWNAWETGLDFFSRTYDKEGKNAWFKYAFEHTDYKNLPEQLKSWILEQEYLTQSVAPAKNSMIGIHYHTQKTLTDSEIDILKRFSKIFEQSYIRFLDLQKAEAQTRESQIQLALERIRASAMAMKSSKDLFSVADVLRDQLSQLGKKDLESSIIHFYPENSSDFEVWYSYRNNLTGQLSRDHGFASKDASSWTKAMIGKYYSKDTNYTIKSTGDMLADWYKVLEKFAPSTVEYDEAGKLTIPEVLYYHFSKFSGGALLMITGEEPDEEACRLQARAAKVFEQAHTRFLDLQKAEAQAREAQIEAALERVRSRTMGMQRSEELSEVIQVVYDQFVHLNIPTEHTGFVMDYKTRDDYNIWIADRFGTPSQVTIPYFDSIYYNRFNEAKKNGIEFFPTVLSFEEKNKFYEDLFKHIPGFPEKSKETILEAPGFAISTALLENVALYIEHFNGTAFSNEENAILLRFGKVFQQTYTRFLDLQNAEAQSRESQIQLALERVRARTMAMQHSDELTDASFVLDSQVRSLGIKTRGCAFNIYGDNESLEWFSSEHGPLPMYKTPREKFFLDYFEKGLSGIPMYVEEFAGDACAAHYEYLCTIPVMGDALRGMIAAGGSFPARQIDHIIYHKYGYLLFITLEPEPEAHEIFIRFAKVFEQTYTRFLDLQKSEAQAREARIEAALERVRAKTMAMQHSDDLLDAATFLFGQIESLGAPAWNCSFNIWSEDKKYATAWNGTKDGFGRPFQTPSSEDVFLEFYKAAQQGDELFVKEIGGKELELHYDYLSTLPGVGITLAELKEAGIALPTFQVFYIAYFAQGYLMFITYEPVPEFADIFKRFAKVFEQTYTRFLDLQKAEAQAREAQIEAALERVRSRAMAMHTSQELTEVALELRQQMGSMAQAELEVCGIHLYDESPVYFESWSAVRAPDHDGKIVLSQVKFPKHGIKIVDEMMEQYHAGKKDYVLINDGEKVPEWFNVMKERVPDAYEMVIKSLNGKRPEDSRAYWSMADFQGGSLIMTTYVPPNDSARHLLRRFANVFGLAYRRFVDLKQAEAQARESQIEAALERVRAAAMSMMTSTELLDVCESIYNQLKNLGFSNLRCAQIYILDDAKQSFLNYEFAEAFKGRIIDIAYDSHPEVTLFVKNLKITGAKLIEVAIPEEKMEEWKNFLYGDLQQSKELLLEQAKELYYNHYGIENGALSISTFTKITEEQKLILERLRNVFGLSYKRYTDLAHAEVQTREAKIETALERVRSRTLAMQKSEELAETAAVLFQQLIALGIEPNRLYIAIVKNDVGDSEFWITDEDGTKISTAFSSNLNDNLSFSKMFEGWKQQRKSLVIDMQGEELKNYFQHLNSIGVPFKGGLTQKRRVQDVAYFSHGFIGIASPDEQPEETLLLLERFAAVFNLTFTRFNDLKLAEAHAIQAEEDLIKLQTEKKRAEDALTELRAAQKQLVQSEKMASLGELTAGIAHEIQNPLNFVNNFSEVSNELIDEMKAELAVGNLQLALELANDISQNLEKINHHGKRADGIVKGMLQHSQSSGTTKEPIDINALADEYLRLAYHGLRAKDARHSANKQFNATLKTDFDKTIGTINIIPQDIGRVVLNVLTNAFYAVNEKKKTNADKYEPIVTVSTKTVKSASGGLGVSISVEDNGNGIPKNIVDKIFQPFFTTKPTGQGTGLGLSLAYDIVKAHGGELKVETKEGEGTIFMIYLPKNN